MKPEKLTFKRETLQRQYIDNETRTNYLDLIAYIEEWINNDFRKALEAEGLSLDLALAQRLSTSHEAIISEINQHRKKYLASLGFVPKSEIDRVHEKFNEVIENLTKPCRIFWDYARTHKFPLVANKQGYITFEASIVNEYVSTLGIKNYSATDVEYMELLQDAAEILVKIRNIEIENDYNPFVLNMLPNHISMGFVPSKVFDMRAIKKQQPINHRDNE